MRRLTIFVACLVLCCVVAGSKLIPPKFQPLPLGAIKPSGWLHDQLFVQARGFSSGVDEVWPDVANSQWIGGWAEGWERFPYYLDGLVPLAVHTQDSVLLAKMKKHINYILANQSDDGWLGPREPNGNFGKKKYPTLDPWPVFVFLKALIQYSEAYPDDKRVIPAMTKFMRVLNSRMDEAPLSNYVWAKYRWQDLSVSIHWLYERTNEDWLLDLSKKAASQGYDWVKHFANFTLTTKSDPKKCDLDCHGVNNAQGIKQGAVQYRERQSDDFKNNPRIAIENLDKYHGAASGVFTCDELLAGLSPAQGTELCTVVEYMFSLEVALANIGDPKFGDKLEQITFNALPSTFDPHMQYHQYVQQPNQVVATRPSKLWYTNDGANSNLYGVAPNYGCCTANYHQGWPKFTSSLWMKAQDGRLVAMSYAPNSVTTQLQGVDVTVNVVTDYPFTKDGVVNFNIALSKPAALKLPLSFRIPEWAEKSSVRIQSKSKSSVLSPAKGQFFEFEVDVEENDVPTVQLILGMEARIQKEIAGLVSIHRGPILFALPRSVNATRVDNCKEGSCDDPYDYELRSTTPWNYALKVNQTDVEPLINFEFQPISSIPYSPDKIPVTAYLNARQVPSWTLDEEYQAAVKNPASPLQSDQPLVTIGLVPFGSTNLRVSVFPYLKL